MYGEMVGDSDSWGGPQNGVDIDAQMGVGVAGSRWDTRITIELWTLVIILGALGILWLMGGVVFRRVNVL